MNNQSIAEYLSSHDFFSELGDEVLEFIAQHTSTHKLKKGEILFQQSERADKFYVIRSGKISIQIPAVMGPTLELQSLGENQILGWSWLIPPYKWNFQSKAEEDSELLEFDGTAILERCEQDPKFGYELLKRFTTLMSSRLEAARQKMMDEWNPAGFA